MGFLSPKTGHRSTPATADVLELFCELAAIASGSGEEREVGNRVVEYLEACGLAVDEDGAGTTVGSTAGNLYTRIPPSVAGEPLFFCAHLDTVPPTAPIEPMIDDGYVRNRANTILGADNKAAIAAILVAIRRLLVEGRAHAGIELLFTVKEEVGLLGASAFDHSRLVARLGYVYDHSAPIGTVVIGAPFSMAIEVTIHGRASHSGFHPEDGRSAIAAAAHAIAGLRLGRIDELSSANVGTITGGTAANVVPEWCTFVAEARSHDEQRLARITQEMHSQVTQAARVVQCEFQTKMLRTAQGYCFCEDSPAVVLAARALTASGYPTIYELSGGGADANVLNERGLQVVNLANGMLDCHTSAERIAVDDLSAMVEVTLGLIEAAAM